MFSQHLPGQKKVKIVATLGPASEQPEMVLKLAAAGVDVFRFNLTHSNLEESKKRRDAIRTAELKVKRPLAIMGDLGGPKIRTGNLDGEYMLEPGQTLKIMREQILGSREAVSLNFPEIVDNLEVGAEIYLNDGMPKLEVEKKIKGGVLARVVVGGTLKPRMGFSAQGLAVNGFKLAAKDKDDIKMMAKIGADALAISFVQSPSDVQAVIKAFPRGYRPMLIAKIETLAGVKNAEDILKVADGLMVARGDLGFAVPMAELPHIQKRLISLALKHSKPVITATQMLESMTSSHLPTRAEVTDVANAILDGTDAVMLSGETARGKYPEEVIKTMAKIVERAAHHAQPVEFKESSEVSDATSASLVKMADQVKARSIFVFTESGASARVISRHRHQQPIVAMSPHVETLRRLAFSRNVFPRLLKNVKTLDQAMRFVSQIASKNTPGNLQKGEIFIVSAGVPFGKSGSTNLILAQRA